MAEIEIGTLRIFAARGGTVNEIVSFLKDVEAAYNSILEFSLLLEIFTERERYFLWRRRWREWFIEFGIPPPWIWLGGLPVKEALLARLPDYGLEIRRIQIESPGFWEFLGALNPLQQIREYLDERHRRRQDREYREQAERERLNLENEMIRRQIWEKENAIFKERIQLLREVGFSEEEIRRIIWHYVSQPLIALGKHQDAGLIQGAE